jgi:hypothetical protein
MSRANDFVIELGTASDAIIRAVDTLLALQREYTFGDYANTLDSQISLSERPTIQSISDSVNTTASALSSLLAAGNGTNLTRTRR